MLAEAAKAAASSVVQALQKASAATGVDFNYLLGTAMKESGLKPEAKSANSSATGLFQFVEQTWLGVVKNYGGKHGLTSYANIIDKGDDGRYRIKDPNDRSAVLRLRNDPQISALMAGEYTKETQSAMEDKLGRKVTTGELYAGHLFGSSQACRLIRTAQGDPHLQACELMPRAADANPNIFYHRDGSPKSAREVYTWTIGQVPATPTLDPGALPKAPSVTSGPLSTETTQAAIAALWTRPRRGFFSSGDEASTSTPPLAMSPAMMEVLQQVAKERAKK